VGPAVFVDVPLERHVRRQAASHADRRGWPLPDDRGIQQRSMSQARRASPPVLRRGRLPACEHRARPRRGPLRAPRYRCDRSTASLHTLRYGQRPCQYPTVWREFDTMARTGTGPERRGEPTLTASDWAEAALQLIAEKGLSALTVSALASRL